MTVQTPERGGCGRAMEMACVILVEGTAEESPCKGPGERAGPSLLDKTAYELCGLIAERAFCLRRKKPCWPYCDLHVHSCLSPCAGRT